MSLLRMLLPFFAAFGITAVLTVAALPIFRRSGWVAQPRPDRWHTGRPCLFGGIPLWLGFLMAAAVFLPARQSLRWQLIGVSSLMFLVGLADDIHPLTPRLKFLLQLLAASLVLAAGLVYPLRQGLAIDLAISLVWIVGIINAFNLLDNMDGLSAGVGLIAALYLAVLYLSRGSLANAILPLALAGALAGFLIFNFKPARIFMGDAGSLFLGATLATSSMLEVSHLSGISGFFFLPILLLAVPIFDTFFVSVTRRLRGQPVSQGGTDHSSHRLVKLGLEERSAVLVLYALSIASGGVALLLHYLYSPYAVGLIGLWFFLLFLFGIHLFQPLPGNDSSHGHASRLVQRVFNRDTLAFILDPAALGFSYYLAYIIRFSPRLPSDEAAGFLISLPIVLAMKFFCFAASGIYRRSWWRGARGDLLRLVQALLLGELLAVVALVGLHRFVGYSRLVFALDVFISLALLLAIRNSFSVFRTLMDGLRPTSSASQRVLLVGTSPGVESSLLFLRDRRVRCVGLIDPNGGIDLGKRLWGSPVLGQIKDLPALAREYNVHEIIVPDGEPLPYSTDELCSLLTPSDMQVTKLGLYSNSKTIS